jgi:heparan-alpha-glucosaminide N-acetyltransferase
MVSGVLPRPHVPSHPTAAKLAPERHASIAQGRVRSVDAFRGFVMLLILAEVLSSCAVSAGLPDWSFWRYVCNQQTHAAWVGFSLHDLIQPSFYFLVGVALLLSISRRHSSGQPLKTLISHAILRSVVLIVLGMALYSVHPRVWMWRFIDTLTQIGLAYPFLLLIALRSRRVWYFAVGAILVGYWFWFATFPLEPMRMDAEIVGASPEWLAAHGLTGFAAHWQKNLNAAFEFDRWFLNLFPGSPYAGDPSGLTTLNFIPSIATMLLGLIAADILQSARAPWKRVRLFCLAGFLLIFAGWSLGVLGICPVVKAIWTPSWVLFSGGWCFLFLAGFYAVVDVAGARRLVFPLTVVGMNSLVAYTISHVYPAIAFNSLRRIVGVEPFRVLGESHEPFVYGCAVVAMYWVGLLFLYKGKIFIRI